MRGKACPGDGASGIDAFRELPKELVPLLGQGPGAGDAVGLLGEQAGALEAVKQGPGLGVVADPQPAADRAAARAGVLGEVLERLAA